MSKPDHEKAKEPQNEKESSEVHEADTDIEHLLKRLTIEKQKQRDKNFGLYR